MIVAILLWAALAIARLIGARLQRVAGISPSVQTLAGNLLKIVLVSLALVIGLNSVGVDLTALAVLGGAIGVGIGLGLQKIVSNFMSGIILLLERSIKPGDVIEVGHAYGTVTSLGARYTAVRGRDAKEYLLPNETLITNQVTNWSYSTPLLRLDIGFGVICRPVSDRRCVDQSRPPLDLLYRCFWHFALLHLDRSSWRDRIAIAARFFPRLLEPSDRRRRARGIRPCGQPRPA